ncbi:MAG: formate--phosphoribosylaminoimidazolecarboxamide ligase [Candidatus Methanomethylicus sp.]|nr:formate--phosphoribosylaminoimidazolecarboxamide ligase [Candidatus Methanomethylicus sp.]
MIPAVATISSHSALQILKGARDEGLRTILLCLREREELYARFNLADRVIPINSVEDLLDKKVQSELLKENSVLVPHGTLISGGKLEEFERSFEPKVLGNKYIFRWEYDRNLKDKLLQESGLNVPRKLKSHTEISGPVIAKLPGAEGGRGYFIAKSPKDFEEKVIAVRKKGLLKKGEEDKIFIQEYIIGVTLYPHYFYSPLSHKVELLGCDRRYETSIDGLGRIGAKDQLDLDIIPTFRVIGNTPMVLRESLLMDIFSSGDGFVAASKRLVKPGSVGPFCLEMICDEEGKLFTFEFSGRIVAGTNLFISGSPYSDLIFGEPMSMGRRIAREIKKAAELGELDKVVT